MRPFRVLTATAAGVAIWFAAAHAQAEDVEGHWLLKFNIRGIGVLETVVEFHGGGRIRGASISTAPLAHTHIFPNAQAKPFVQMNLRSNSEKSKVGRLRTVFGDGDVSVSLKNGVLSGTFDGEVSGTFTGAPFENQLPLRDYGSVLRAIDTHTKQWLYDARLMATDQWKIFHDSLARATAAAQDDFDMIEGFRRAWGDGLFSHYALTRPLNSLDELIRKADREAQEKPVVRIEFTRDNIAVVTIDSFFGARIEKQIDAAFQEVIERNAKALVIDVRENAGGTLAAWPVAARLIQSEVIGGYFIANKWWAGHDALPTTDFLLSTPSPVEVTPQAFQQDLLSDGIMVMRIAPARSIYSGPAYALISPRSRSATEAVIGVLQYLGRIQTVGEPSAGYMLNSNLFQIAGGFTLRIPIADFFLPNHKSLEAVGVIPDIPADSDSALNVVIEQIRRGGAGR